MSNIENRIDSNSLTTSTSPDSLVLSNGRFLNTWIEETSSGVYNLMVNVTDSSRNEVVSPQTIKSSTELPSNYRIADPRVEIFQNTDGSDRVLLTWIESNSPNKYIVSQLIDEHRFPLDSRQPNMGKYWRFVKGNLEDEDPKDCVLLLLQRRVFYIELITFVVLSLDQVLTM